MSGVTTNEHSLRVSYDFLTFLNDLNVDFLLSATLECLIESLVRLGKRITGLCFRVYFIFSQLIFSHHFASSLLLTEFFDQFYYGPLLSGCCPPFLIDGNSFFFSHFSVTKDPFDQSTHNAFANFTPCLFISPHQLTHHTLAHFP